MSDELHPYISNCSFCGDGLLRFRRCDNCDRVVAVCDECELMWEDVKGVSHDANLSSDSSFPQCPACGHREAAFSAVTIEELEDLQLQTCVEGESV